MIREIIFILILFFIAGCGMSGSNTKDDSKDISVATIDTSNDLNVTDFGTQIAVAEVEEDTILPQTFSIAFPDILKKGTQKDESNSTTSQSNQTDNLDVTTLDSNQTEDSNVTILDSNQTEDSNVTISDTNQTEESNTTINENNQTVTYCDETVDEENQTNNIAYDNLTDKIEKIERVIKISQVNLTVLEKTMPKIMTTCSNIDFNITCPPFKEGELSVVMDNETRVQVSSIIDENNITFPDINESGVSLGEVIYKRYSDDTLYQFGLSHEMSAKETNSSKKELYLFKWSNSNEDTLTQYSYEDNITISRVSIHYLTGEDEKELMHVTFLENNTLLGKKEIMNLTLVKKGDENGSFTITSNSIEEFRDGNETNTSRFSSNGDISKDSSLLLFSGSVSSENNITDEEMTKTIQDNRVRCNVPNDEESNIELYELNITDSSLENGEYLLFPPNTAVQELSSLEIYEDSIGSFTVDGDKIQGGIKGDSYEDILNSLIIIKLIDTQESTEMFNIVPNEQKPNLKIVKY